MAELVERRGLFAPAGVAAPAEHAASSPPVGAADPARGAGIWVVAELFAGAVRRVTLELLATARRLAAERGEAVAAVLLGHDVARHVELLAAHGADRVLLADDARLASYATEPYAAVLAAAIAAESPSAVLVPSTYVGRDLAPRVAGRLGLGLTGDCIDLSIDAAGRLVQWKPAFGGNVVAPILSRTRPDMATVRPGVLPVAAPRPETAGSSAGARRASASRLRVLERRVDPSAARAAALDEAEVAIGIGLGIGGPESHR